MKTAEFAAVPFGLASAIRRRRIFHPNGILGSGSIERLAPPGDGLPVASCAIVARISKALGLPGGLPDITGLAIRLPPEQPAATPWDVLMVSAGAGRFSRVALRPVTSWSARMSTLMPLIYDHEYWWLQGELETQTDKVRLSLNDIAKDIQEGELVFLLRQARGSHEFQPLARVVINALVAPGSSHDLAFDPTINSGPGVTLAPAWLTSIRRQAYRGSRRGRNAVDQTPPTVSA